MGVRSVVYNYVSQHIKRDQLSQKIKIIFLPFPKWLFFHLNFGAKNFINGNFIEDVLTDW